MLLESLITHSARRFTNTYMLVQKNFKPQMSSPEAEKGLMLYIHIPFCEELCPYCSFFKISFDHTIAENYFVSLLKEIKMYYELGYKFDSVYIGGGTPTVLPLKLKDLVLYVKDLWPIKDISVETNPNHLKDKYLDPLRGIGITRLSVGVQSFNDSLLKKLKRYNKYGSGAEILKRLKEIKPYFDTVNIDMMFNFPEQTKEMLIEDLEKIDELNGDQVTYYPLMPSSTLRADISKNVGKVDYRKEKKFYDIICKMLTHKYERPSAWCFSQKGTLTDEYIVDYNQYIGCGAGAFSYSNGEFRANHFSINSYSEKIEREEFPIQTGRVFSNSQQILYEFLMNLFSKSLSIDQLKSRYGRFAKIPLFFPLTFFKMMRIIEKKENTYYLTEKGMYILVILMREFFTSVNNVRHHCNIVEKT